MILALWIITLFKFNLLYDLINMIMIEIWLIDRVNQSTCGFFSDRSCRFWANKKEKEKSKTNKKDYNLDDRINRRFHNSWFDRRSSGLTDWRGNLHSWMLRGKWLPPLWWSSTAVRIIVFLSLDFFGDVCRRFKPHFLRSLNPEFYFEQMTSAWLLSSSTQILSSGPA